MPRYRTLLEECASEEGNFAKFEFCAALSCDWLGSDLGVIGIINLS